MDFLLGAFIVVVVALILYALTLVLNTPSTKDIVQDQTKLARTETVSAIDAGNGVYFLDVADGPSWVASLTRFIKEHPTLRITAIAPATEGKLGAYSHLLITEHRHDCPCHVGD